MGGGPRRYPPRQMRGRMRPGKPLSPDLERPVPRRIHAGAAEEFPQRADLLLRQAVLGVVEALGMAVQLHQDLAMAAMGDIGAQFLERREHMLRVEIGADRVGEQRMQGLAVVVVHGMAPVWGRSHATMPDRTRPCVRSTL